MLQFAFPGGCSHLSSWTFFQPHFPFFSCNVFIAFLPHVPRSLLSASYTNSVGLLAGHPESCRESRLGWVRAVRPPPPVLSSLPPLPPRSRVFLQQRALYTGCSGLVTEDPYAVTAEECSPCGQCVWRGAQPAQRGHGARPYADGHLFIS